MRDTREAGLLLVLLIAIAFALITVDIRGGEGSPIDGARKAAATVLGPVESGVAGAVDPIGNAVGAVRDSGGRHDRIAALERENAALKTRLGSDARNQSRVRQLDAMLKKAAPASTASAAPRSSPSAPPRVSPGPSPSTRAARTASPAT
ncbi:hypothetical protein SDIAM26S_04176 [Streptomyces diastaticus subsp. diastaticus]